MYESQTYEVILQRMLDRVSNDVDKRQGSIIYDALAPAALELAQMYIDLDTNINLSYADTATGEYLERRAGEFGINRKQATFAKRKGVFYASGDVLIDVPIGSRYSIGDLNYIVSEKISKGQFILTSETVGTAGNEQFGSLIPIEYIENLARAELTDILVAGADEETDESLRNRYYEAVNEQPFGGNIADYKQKIQEIDGVGGVKIYPTWQGGGTVKATIISSDYNPPSTALVSEVQTIIDPTLNSGQGIGQAPIGHQVTIFGATSSTINVTARIVLQSGTTIGQIQQDVEDTLNAYLLSLRQSWKDEVTTTVRISQIESRILTVSGILDVSETTLNGATSNVTLTSDQIPTMGTVTLSE